MQVFYGWAYLIEVALNFNFMKALSAAQKFVQRLILAKLQQNIDIFCILKEMLESNNVVVMQTSMNLNFGHKLLFCPWFGQGCLRDDLGGRYSLSFKVCEFIALGKTSFSEEFAAKILLDANITVEFDDFLFNNDLCIVLLVLLRLRSLLLLLHMQYSWLCELFIEWRLLLL